MSASLAERLVRYIKNRGGVPCSIEEMNLNIKKGMLANREKRKMQKKIVEKYAEEAKELGKMMKTDPLSPDAFDKRIQQLDNEMQTERIQMQDKWLARKLAQQDRIDLGYLTPIQNFETPYFLENNWQFFRQFFTAEKEMKLPYTSWFYLPDGQHLIVKDFGEPGPDHDHTPVNVPPSEGPVYEESASRGLLFQVLFEQMLKVIYNPEKDYDKDLKIVSDVNRYTETMNQYPLFEADDFQIQKWDLLIKEDMARFNFYI